ncbi:MAG: DUF805 domain-containing protein [Bacteroidota bacterium]
MIKAPFSFEGRIRRLEYGISSLLAFSAVLIILYTSQDYPVLWVLAIPLLWFTFAARAKRCHDIGFSAWFKYKDSFQLLLKDGEIGPNQYGENPKGPGYEAHGHFSNAATGKPQSNKHS